jgi:protein-S-isoprenylcysteine O-methyltransferase Ste14
MSGGGCEHLGGEVKSRKIVRHILGYSIGITLFFAAVPFCLFRISANFDGSIGFVIFTTDTIRIIVSSIFFFVGIIFAVLSNIYLFSIGKGGPTDAFGIAVSPRTRALVMQGPYRYSRNPMVFGAFMVYLSVSFYLNSIATLVTVLAGSILFTVYLKAVEEKRLMKDFGTEYEHYRRQVSMIVPLPWKNR